MRSKKRESGKMTLEFTKLSSAAAMSRKRRAKAKGMEVGFHISAILTQFDILLSHFDWIHGRTWIFGEEIYDYRYWLTYLERQKKITEPYILNKIVMDELCVGSISVRGRNIKQYYDFGRKIQSALEKLGIDCDIFDLENDINLDRLFENVKLPKLKGIDAEFLDIKGSVDPLYHPIPLEPGRMPLEFELPFVDNPGEEVSK